MTFATYPSVNEITRNAGFLYWGPTNLAIEAGYGTLLGYVSSLIFRPNHTIADIADEESGESPQLSVFVGAKPQLIANLRNYNATVLARLFPGLTGSTYKSVSFPGSQKSGDSIYTTYQGTLLYVPDNTTSDFVILLKSCCPRIPTSGSVILSHTKEAIWPCIFLAKQYYLGLLSGATL